MLKYYKCKGRIDYALKIKEECLKAGSNQASSTSIQLFSEFVKFLFSLAQKKCPYLNCRRESKQVKKEGANKIFLIDRDYGEE